MGDDDDIDPEALSVIAAACRDREFVRFEYRGGDGESSKRIVEPHQLVTSDRRWYLVAWDQTRQDWRTFRLDRLREPRISGDQFPPRGIPGGDAADFVATSLASTPRQAEARITVQASFAELESVLRWVDHTPFEGETNCNTITIRSEDLGRLAMTVARIALTAPITVIEPAELAAVIQRLALHLTVNPA
ncbi:WYL domain-containing protein [Deinococcus sp. Arct2-2]|uniref:helix-turn-helix transcriptional regulator n=1 Tax=Deinococcus sp. Arct2-2 TaxID=2568653 RepID=UPI001F0EE52B|nr:WYL domain-containing protein [Deinococcus sp. Arct2-2]